MMTANTGKHTGEDLAGVWRKAVFDTATRAIAGTFSMAFAWQYRRLQQYDALQLPDWILLDIGINRWEAERAAGEAPWRR